MLDPMIISVLAGIIILVVGIVYLCSTLGNPLRSIAPNLSGKILFNGDLQFQLQGQDVFIKYTAPSKNQSAEIRFYTKGALGGQLLIRPETSQDGFYKKIGLNRELDIADRDLSEKLYFECDDQEFLTQFFDHNGMKSEVFDLLDYYSDIEITPKTCLFKRYPAPTIDSLSNPEIFKFGNELLELAKKIPSTGGNHPEIIFFRFKAIILYAIGTFTLAAGVICFIWSTQYPVVEDAKLWIWASNYSLVISVTVMALVFFIIKGFSTSSKVFIYFLWTFCIGSLLLGRYGCAVYNGYFDRSPVEIFDQTVIDKYITYGKHSTYYHVVVSPWRPEQSRAWSFTVGYGEYQSVSPVGTRYRISTHKGYIGYEWVQSEQRIIDNQDF